jgi:isopropylmalate/homocitrate/citramalate synthase
MGWGGAPVLAAYATEDPQGDDRMARIHFIDVTNRDGVQTSRIKLSKFQKTMVNWYVSKLGVYQSEFGFPFSDHEFHYIQGNLALQHAGVFGPMVLGGWVRALRGDVEKAIAVGCTDLNLSMSTSDLMLQLKFRGKFDRAAVVREMEEAVTAAKAGGIRTIGVNAEDASRTDIAQLIEFAQAAKAAGAVRFRYCDTLGFDSPRTIYDRITRLAEAVRIPIEPHCHDDLGMANANSVRAAQAAVDAGVDAYINATVNGNGERAGQADLLSCILAIKYANGLQGYEIGETLDLSWAWRLGNYVARSYGLPVPIRQVGIGANAFAHESGIHADGALKDRHNYELYDYELLGRPEVDEVPTGRVITTGEYGGLAGFKYVYDQMGVTFADNDEAAEVLELVQVANGHNQKPLLPDELRFIAAHPDAVRTILTTSPWRSARQQAADGVQQVAAG